MTAISFSYYFYIISYSVSFVYFINSNLEYFYTLPHPLTPLPTLLCNFGIHAPFAAIDTIQECRLQQMQCIYFYLYSQTASADVTDRQSLTHLNHQSFEYLTFLSGNSSAEI